jgi:hypothetical protein
MTASGTKRPTVARAGGLLTEAVPKHEGVCRTAAHDPEETSWKQAARQPLVCGRLAPSLQAVDHSTTRVGLRATGRDTL